MLISRKSLMILGIALSTTFVSCASKKPNKGTAETGNAGSATVETGSGDGTVDDAASKLPPASKVDELAAAWGILNFRQVTATFATLTGVQLNAPAAAGGVAPAAEYLRAISALPTDYAPAATTAGKVASTTKLGATYCDVLGNNAQLLGQKFPGLSLAAVPADSAAFAKTLLDGFYGPETSLQGPRAADIATVAASVDALKGLAGATGPAVFMGVCAGIISSAEFFLY